MSNLRFETHLSVHSLIRKWLDMNSRNLLRFFAPFNALRLIVLSGVVSCVLISAPCDSMASPSPQEPAEVKDDETEINEQTIYVPYEKLREVFEKDGRGVFIPYDKFQKLWNEARSKQPKPVDTSAPLGAVISDIDSIASLGKEIVNVDATVKVELLRKGWHRVPLRLSNSAIRSATIDGQNARIIQGSAEGYELLVEHAEDESKTIELKLSYAKALEKARGQSSVSFQSPQAPVNRWTIRTGQKGIDIEIEPMIATTKKDPAEVENDEQGVGDEILAFVGAAPNVVIRWTPKAEGATGLAALVSAETQQRIRIDQGVTRTSATIALDISRAEVDSVKLAISPGHKIVNVFDRNVKKWDVEEKDGDQIVSIEFFEPALGRQSLAVELEKFIDDIEAEEVQAAKIQVIDASRNQGIVLVNMTSGLRAEASNKSGLLQIDKTELPQSLAKQPWNFVYRYASLPYTLSLNVKKIQPLINVEQWVQIALEPQKMSAELNVEYDIQQAGVFQLLLDIPSEFEIRDVRPNTANGVTGAAIDTYYKDENNENRWIVTLSRKGFGRVGLTIVLQRDLSDPNLLSPTGSASEIKLEIPKVALEGVEFSSGSVVVYAPESLQINATETTGLRNEAFENAMRGRPSLSTQNVALRPVLTYGFANSDATLNLQVKRRKPQITVEQLLVVSINSGVVKYDARLFYDIRYSGVKSLRLDVPTPLVDELRKQSNNIIHQKMEPQPADVPDGYTAWKLTGEKEFFDRHEVRFTWERNTDELPLGESLDVQVDRLMPLGADRASGQIVTTKSETIDIRPKDDAVGLRAIDPQTDLTSGISMPDAAMAFEFVDDWSLSLTATRYELENLKRTSISRSLVRVVSLRQNELSVQALYNIRSVDQRIAIQMPEGFDPATSFDDQPIRVNGQRVTPERGGSGLIYVPLTGQSADTPFLLELRYSIPGGHRQIDLPVFPDDPAVQKVALCVYLPHENALIYKSGKWTDKAIDVDSTLFSRMFNRRNEDVNRLLSWVQEGTQVTTNNQKFETDGRPYVFTSLRPESPPDGSLRLRTFNLTALNVLFCIAIAAVGLFMLPQRFTTQLAALVLLLALFVGVGLFFPLVTEHLVGEALLATLGIVAVVWIVLDTGRWWRARMAERELNRRQRTTRVSPEVSSEPPPGTEEEPPKPADVKPTDTATDDAEADDE